MSNGASRRTVLEESHHILYHFDNKELASTSNTVLFKMSNLNETVGISLGILTLMGSAVTFFVQRRQEKRNEAIANRNKEMELDRQQALERIRWQLGSIVGPLHRLYKTQNTVILNYMQQEDAKHGMDHHIQAIKGGNVWITMFRNDFLKPFLDNPASPEAQRYRNFVSRRLSPIITRFRELVLSHGSDLDLPTQEEWFAKYDQQRVTSPIIGSPNVNVILDTYCAWTLEFDDIIESWAEEDFTRAQPTTVVAWAICNDLVDLLYENAKTKEAKYNKHVTVHKNVVDADGLGDQLKSSLKSYRDLVPDQIENV